MLRVYLTFGLKFCKELIKAVYLNTPFWKKTFYDYFPLSSRGVILDLRLILTDKHFNDVRDIKKIILAQQSDFL